MGSQRLRVTELVEVTLRHWLIDPAVVERLPTGIFGGIFSNHHRLSGSLEKGGESVVDEAIVLILSVVGIENLHHIALGWLKLLLKERRKIHLPDEAYSLRVFLVCRRKISLVGNLPDFRFGQVPDWEKSLAELLLSELTEKIALVFVWINTLQNPPLRLTVNLNLLTVSVQQRSTAAIMSGRHHVGPKFLGGLEKSVKLDLPVAQNVWVGGAAGGIFIEHVINDALAVLLGKIDKVEWNADFPRDHLRHEAVLLPFAVTVKRCVRIVPILHEHREHIVPLPLQQQSGDT